MLWPLVKTVENDTLPLSEERVRGELECFRGLLQRTERHGSDVDILWARHMFEELIRHREELLAELSGS